MYGYPENYQADSVIIGKKNLQAFLTVMTISPIPNGNMFLLTPYHFHDGSQDNVIESSQFEKGVEGGFRSFMRWVRSKLDTD